MTEQTQQWEVTIKLPLQDNDGKELTDVIANTLDTIVLINGGYSAWNERGAWASNGKTYYDQSLHVQVITDDSNKVAQLRNVAATFKHNARQESVYFQVRDAGTVEFI